MNLVRCEKGHFYDRDKNGDHCPYCAQMAAASAPQPAPAPAAPAPAPRPAAPSPSAPQPAAPRQPEPRPAEAAAPAAPRPPRPEAPSPAHAPAAAQAAPGPVPGSPAQASGTPGSVTGIIRDTAASMQNAVSDIMADTEDNCTVGYYSRVIGVEPVVGWLVCTEGEYKGESFKLKSGRNFIGRAANMDVVLSADHSISRFKHAAVIYEPRSRQFIVTAGESRELCYLNGEVVLSNIKMEAYDILNLGNTSLMLVPCCGKRFSWEEGLVKEEEKEEK